MLSQLGSGRHLVCLVSSEEIYVAIPEPADQVVVQPNEEIVPTPGEGASPAVSLSPAGKDIPMAAVYCKFIYLSGSKLV